MPQKNETNPTSRRSQLLQWYSEHPGFHRCMDVAADIGLSTHVVAAASRELAEEGRLAREPFGPTGRRNKYGNPDKETVDA